MANDGSDRVSYCPGTELQSGRHVQCNIPEDWMREYRRGQNKPFDHSRGAIRKSSCRRIRKTLLKSLSPLNSFDTTFARARDGPFETGDLLSTVEVISLHPCTTMVMSSLELPKVHQNLMINAIDEELPLMCFLPTLTEKVPWLCTPAVSPLKAHISPTGIEDN